MATFVDERQEDEAELPQFEAEENQGDPKEDLQATQVEEQDPEDDIPEKYRGKSIKDLVGILREQEKFAGKQSQEVGDLRNIVKSYVERKAELEAPKEEEQVDFFADPDRALDQRVEAHPAIQEAKEASLTMRQEQARNRVTSAHPDFMEVMGDPSFAKWVTGSKVRTELFIRADQEFDADAGIELLDTWKGLRDSTKQAAKVNKEVRLDAAKQASTGSATGSSEPRPRKTFRSADLMKLRQEDPDRYDAMQEEILKAYAEGRVTY